MPRVIDEQSEPFRLIEFDEVDSTNAEALRRAADGERGPLWIMAHRQTRGRGRSGRVWHGGAGNLLATWLFAPGCPPAALHQLSLLTGIAVHDTIAELAGARRSDVRLKWPNDILLNGEKLGGILVESTMFGNSAVAAIGIGINIAHAPAVAGRSVASLVGAGFLPTAPKSLLLDLNAKLAHWLGTWTAGANFDAVLAAWLDRAGQIGESITVHRGNDLITGTYAGLAPDGALLVRDHDGSITRVTAGDVSLGA